MDRRRSSPRASRHGVLPPVAGIGLRFPHHRHVVEAHPRTGWFEVHTENYLGGGTPLSYLNKVRGDYPLSLHGVGLSLGSAEGLDRTHLARVRDLVARSEPALVSEHLSFSVTSGVYLADLLPLPLTEEALDVVCRNVETLQDTLGRKILIENPSSYLRYAHSTIPEGDFLAAVVKRSGCGLLCDVNNVYVSCSNHGWDASRYLDALPAEAIGEIHLAGHALRDIGGRTIRIDDHGSRVCDAVWSLYAEALERFGPVPSLIEWDTDIPAFAVLEEEAAKADRIIVALSEKIHDDAA